MKTLGVLLLGLVVLALGSNVQDVTNTCFDSIAKLCVHVQSLDCFQLTAMITLNDQSVWENDIPIGDLLEAYQAAISRNGTSTNTTLCSSFNRFNFECSLCSTAKELKLEGQDLHYCGSLSVSCHNTLTGQHFAQTLNPDCVNIQNCGIYGCRNDCANAGTCSALGMCVCDEGHYGLDCSIRVKDNCIQSNEFDRTCWKAEFPDCNTVDYSVSVNDIIPLVNSRTSTHGGTLQILPCQKFTGASNLNCETCVTAEKLSTEGEKLMGCPNVQILCDGTQVAKYELDCITLAQSPALVCPLTPSPPSGHTNTSLSTEDSATSKTVLWFFVGVLVLFAIIGLSYFVYTKWDCAPYKTTNYFEEDETALKAQIDDDSELN